MPRRANSFARALTFASKRLERLLAERETAQQRLAEISLEIPQLQDIISALSGEVVMPNVRTPSKHRAETSAAIPPPNLSPEDLAKWYSNQDLSGVRSILPERPATPAPTSEEETLPDDFAIGKK